MAADAIAIRALSQAVMRGLIESGWFSGVIDHDLSVINTDPNLRVNIILVIEQSIRTYVEEYGQDQDIRKLLVGIPFEDSENALEKEEGTTRLAEMIGTFHKQLLRLGIAEKQANEFTRAFGLAVISKAILGDSLK